MLYVHYHVCWSLKASAFFCCLFNSVTENGKTSGLLFKTRETVSRRKKNCDLISRTALHALYLIWVLESLFIQAASKGKQGVGFIGV
jgi:hypothetical protein